MLSFRVPPISDSFRSKVGLVLRYMIAHAGKKKTTFMCGKMSQADSGPCRLRKSDNLGLVSQVHDDRDNYFNMTKFTPKK